MKQQIRYVWEDLIRYKKRNIILFIQIAVILILLSSIFSILLDADDFQNKLDDFIKNQEEEIYYYYDISDEKRINEILGDKDNFDSLKELYDFIKKNSYIQTFTADQSYNMWLSNNDIDISFAVDPRSGPNEHFLLKIDDKFQNIFKLMPAKGRLFNNNDFTDEGNEIPLILGFDFQGFYELDDTIYDDMGTCYRIIGFLEKGSYYLSPIRGSEIFWLDRAFIIPIQLNKFIDPIDYDSVINSTYIITDNSEDLYAIQA
ncbi:MAG: hypothetical protein K8S14_09220 [Actinomycetia bacterium]|nr:hypothetical protein [Actinomycetes bacterium]